MMLDNLGTFALEQIKKYTEMFRAYSNAQVEAALARERGNRGWTSQRSYYLAALRQECEQRGIPYSLR